MPDLFSRFFGMPERVPLGKRFWGWFCNNCHRLTQVDFAQPLDHLNPLFDEIQAQLDKVHKGLTCEFGKQPEGDWEFIVSADGIRDRFPAVQKLVAAAPEIPGWKITAFRPPREIGTSIVFQGVELGPDDVWFAAEPYQGLVGLNLYIRDLSPENEKILIKAMFILLDSALGEYVVETKLGYLKWEALPVDPVAARLKSFRQLPETVRDLAQ